MDIKYEIEPVFKIEFFKIQCINFKNKKKKLEKALARYPEMPQATNTFRVKQKILLIKYTYLMYSAQIEVLAQTGWRQGLHFWTKALFSIICPFHQK